MPDTPKKFANFAKFADEVVQAILHRLHCPLGRRYEWANWQDVELAVRDQI